MVNEQALRQIRAEIEGFKNTKMRAELQLEQLTQDIANKKKELKELGIEKEEDLVNLEAEISKQYQDVVSKLEKYRGVVK